MDVLSPDLSRRLDSDELVQWMLAPPRASESIVDLIHGLCLRLSQEGMPLFRVNILVRTLHPQLEFMVFTWQPCDASRVAVNTSSQIVVRREHVLDGYLIEEFLLGHGHVKEETFRNSPFHLVLNGTSEIRAQLAGATGDLKFPILADLVALGVQDYFALPLQLRDPYGGALSFSTLASGGFSDEWLIRLRNLQRIISLFLSPVLTQQAARVVLGAYLGADPANRVMEGAVRLGDLGELEAVIGFIDLRRYTEVCEKLEAEALIELLDSFFTELHSLLLDKGGEILKFMGDGALFVFPIAEDSPKQVCRQAADAVEDLERRIDLVNQSRLKDGLEPFEYGMALHTGRVLYGNIGAPSRMDFTVIGPAVNLTSRLEGLCGRLALPLVVTDAFAAHLPGRFQSLGHHRVRGVSGDLEVFGRA